MIRFHRPFLLTLVLLIFTGCTTQPAVEIPGRIIIRNTNTPADITEIHQIIPGQPTLAEISGSRQDVLRAVDPDRYADHSFGIPLNNEREFWIVQDDGTRTRVVDMETGKPVELTLKGMDWCAKHSPDGQRIALIGDEGLFITGPDGKAGLILERSSQAYKSSLGYGAGNAFSAIDCPIWISDEDLLVSYLGGAFPSEITTQPLSGPGVISTLDATAVIHISPRGSDLRPLNPRWCITELSPDRKTAVVGTWSEGSGGISGGRFYEGCESSAYYLADVDFLITGEGAAPVDMHAQCEGVHRCEGFKFSADGTRLGFFEQHELDSQESEYFVNVWDVTRKTGIGKFKFQEQHTPGSLVWAPDASALAYSLWSDSRIFILTADGKTVKLRTENTFPLELLGWIDE